MKKLKEIKHKFIFGFAYNKRYAYLNLRKSYSNFFMTLADRKHRVIVCHTAAMVLGKLERRKEKEKLLKLASHLSSSREWLTSGPAWGRWENAPEHWEKPLGSQDSHLVVVGLAPDTARLEAAFHYAREAARDLLGVVPIWQQYAHAAADLRNMFGFADGIAHPAVEGTGIPGTNPYEVPLKAGEFVLGYEDEFHNISPVPQPRGAGPQRHLRSLPQAAHSHSRFPPVPAPARQGPHRGGVAGPRRSSDAGAAGRRWH